MASLEPFEDAPLISGRALLLKVSQASSICPSGKGKAGMKMSVECWWKIEVFRKKLVTGSF